MSTGSGLRVKVRRWARRVVLDHAQDLTEKPGLARDTASELIAIGLRRALTCPAPVTLDRRIASWQAFHRMRNLGSPFSAPLVQQARRAIARPCRLRRTASDPVPSSSPRRPAGGFRHDPMACAGFLTLAALDGAPRAAARNLSLRDQAGRR
jgi:hypothetical protein